MMRIDEKSARGETKYGYDASNKTMYSTIMDKKPVYLLSTAFGNPSGHTVRRWIRGRHTDMKAPLALDKYNQHMGGVDHYDAIRAGVSTELLGLRRWWLKLVFVIWDMGIINATTAFNVVHERRRAAGAPHKNVGYKEFAWMLIKELKTWLDSEAEHARDASLRYERRNQAVLAALRMMSPPRLSRQAVELPDSPDSPVSGYASHQPRSTTTGGRCIVCASKGKEKRSRTKCAQCDRHYCKMAKRDCFSWFHYDASPDERKACEARKRARRE
jgi:hypothetical protein